jgi:hypothetical protein
LGARGAFGAEGPGSPEGATAAAFGDFGTFGGLGDFSATRRATVARGEESSPRGPTLKVVVTESVCLVGADMRTGLVAVGRRFEL